jgi:hypothetical protein
MAVLVNDVHGNHTWRGGEGAVPQPCGGTVSTSAALSRSMSCWALVVA